MRIVVSGKEHEFDPGKMLNTEVIAFTKQTGVPFQEIGKRLQAFDWEVITALVWILQRRDQPDLKYDDVSFPISDIQIRDDEAPKGTSAKSTTKPTSRSSRASSR